MSIQAPGPRYGARSGADWAAVVAGSARASATAMTDTLTRMAVRLATAAVAACAAVGAAASQTAPEVPLPQQVGQLIVVGFDGTTLPTSLASVLKRRGLGGVILFGRNVASRSQL